MVNTNCCAHKTFTHSETPLQNTIKQTKMDILLTDMHEFLTPSMSGSCSCADEFMHTYLWMCIFLASRI